MDHIGLIPREVAAYETIVPMSAIGWKGTLFTEEDSLSRTAGWVISLSEIPCDFAATHGIKTTLDNRQFNFCRSETNSLNADLRFVIVAPNQKMSEEKFKQDIKPQSSNAFFCELEANKKYYLNIKTQSDRCQTDKNCNSSLRNCEK